MNATVLAPASPGDLMTAGVVTAPAGPDVGIHTADFLLILLGLGAPAPLDARGTGGTRTSGPDGETPDERAPEPERRGTPASSRPGPGAGSIAGPIAPFGAAVAAPVTTAAVAVPASPAAAPASAAVQAMTPEVATVPPGTVSGAGRSEPGGGPDEARAPGDLERRWPAPIPPPAVASDAPRTGAGATDPAPGPAPVVLEAPGARRAVEPTGSRGTERPGPGRAETPPSGARLLRQRLPAAPSVALASDPARAVADDEPAGSPGAPEASRATAALGESGSPWTSESPGPAGSPGPTVSPQPIVSAGAIRSPSLMTDPAAGAVDGRRAGRNVATATATAGVAASAPATSSMPGADLSATGGAPGRQTSDTSGLDLLTEVSAPASVTPLRMRAAPRNASDIGGTVRVALDDAMAGNGAAPGESRATEARAPFAARVLHSSAAGGMNAGDADGTATGGEGDSRAERAARRAAIGRVTEATTGADAVAPGRPAAVPDGESRAAAAPGSRPVVEQVVSRVSLLHREGRHEIALSLDPPDLGAIKVEAVLEGRTLTLHIRAEREPARELLVEGLPRLRESLSQHGFATEGLTVELGLGDAARGFHDHGAPVFERAPSPAPPAPAAAGRPAVTRSAVPNPEGVDLLV